MYRHRPGVFPNETSLRSDRVSVLNAYLDYCALPRTFSDYQCANEQQFGLAEYTLPDTYQQRPVNRLCALIRSETYSRICTLF